MIFSTLYANHKFMQFSVVSFVTYLELSKEIFYKSKRLVSGFKKNLIYVSC